MIFAQKRLLTLHVKLGNIYLPVSRKGTEKSITDSRPELIYGSPATYTNEINR